MKRGKKLFSIVLVFVCLYEFMLFPKIADATTNNGIIVEKELLTAFGRGFFGKNKGKYNFYSFIVHIGLNAHYVLPFIFKDTNRSWILYLEPQYNVVVKPSGNYEYGVGFGLEYRYRLRKDLYGYGLIGSGFHYISYSSKYQASGFNFNDNIGMGLYWILAKNSVFNIGIRFRHISNADIKKPNDGINAILFVFGYSWFFR